MRNKSIALVALVALVAVIGGLSAANASLWVEPSRNLPIISPAQAHNMTQAQLAENLNQFRAINNMPEGSVLINATLNEWCVSNCNKLTQIDSSLFATEQTQLAKLERTSQFLNNTYPFHNGYWCEAQKSIHKFGSFNC